ncbi:hypothetical protein EV356DRAFT_537062 [Viridothelium virens]|uniref:Mid2 domain-containing protein n=1 Tax=Viridothelium virens TaxID=1048519 RepID=A0A6A6GVS3_VIRVR|nr:hypothetical protein EV356DRAFT_537062 [Viridothelium virens]
MPSDVQSFFLYGTPSIFVTPPSSHPVTAISISVPRVTKSVSTTITPTSHPTAATTQAPAPAPVSTSTGGSSTNAGVLGGSIAGAISGTALIVGLGAYLLRRWRRTWQGKKGAYEPSSVEQGILSQEKETEEAPKSVGSVELEANESRFEPATATNLAKLPTPMVISELDGREQPATETGSEPSAGESHSRSKPD